MCMDPGARLLILNLVASSNMSGKFLKLSVLRFPDFQYQDHSNNFIRFLRGLKLVICMY